MEEWWGSGERVVRGVGVVGSNGYIIRFIRCVRLLPVAKIGVRVVRWFRWRACTTERKRVSLVGLVPCRVQFQRLIADDGRRGRDCKKKSGCYVLCLQCSRLVLCFIKLFCGGEKHTLGMG